MNETRGQWVSTSEAAAALRCSERTIQRRANAGKLTARKVVTGDGEKWQINLGAATSADSGDKVTPESADTLNKRESGPTAPQIGIGADSDANGVPTGDATRENAKLWAQLEAMNAALKREQSAHEQTRQLLAGALQLASRQLKNVTPPEPQQRAPDATAGNDATASGSGVKSAANARESGGVDYGAIKI